MSEAAADAGRRAAGTGADLPTASVAKPAAVGVAVTELSLEAPYSGSG
ncbi:hypothetical protein AB0P07_15235 [Streptomyces sp. NPDC085944]